MNKRMLIWIALAVVAFVALQLWGRLAPPPADWGPAPQLRGVNPRNGASLDWQVSSPYELPAAFELVCSILQDLPRTEGFDSAGGFRTRSDPAAPYIFQDREIENRYAQISARSLVFGFADDLEVLALAHNRSIQVQSQARCGSLDFGVNARRVLAVKAEYDRRWPAIQATLNVPDYSGQGAIPPRPRPAAGAPQPTPTLERGDSAPLVPPPAAGPLPHGAPGSDTDPADPSPR